MHRKLFFLLIPVGLLASPYRLFAQDLKALEKDADRLVAEFRDTEALDRYNQILRLQPRNLSALCKASELYSRLGKRQSSRATQIQYYENGNKLAKRALLVNPNSAEANFVMAMSMGRMAQISSGEKRITAVKDIRNYALRCVQLDPKSFKGYHILAKWNYEVSNLNALERWLVKVAYGSLPEASLRDAIRYYEMSRQLNPGFALNYLELAKACRRNGETARAIELLRHMLALPDRISDDETIKAEGRVLLNDWTD